MRKKKVEEVMILIGYKDTPGNRQALRMAAAKEGHGSVSALIRKAVTAYLKKNHPKEWLKTG
jgi:hypothetical protein